MVKRNLTLQLEADVIRRARVVAAKRGTSLSAMVAHRLNELVADEERYEDAWRRARELIEGSVARGGRSWTRDELHER